MSTTQNDSNVSPNSKHIVQKWILKKYHTANNWSVDIPRNSHPDGYLVTHEKPIKLNNKTIVNSKYGIVCYQMPYKNFDYNRALVERTTDCSDYCEEKFDESYENITVEFFVNHATDPHDQCEHIKNPRNTCSCEPCFGFLIRSNRRGAGFTLYDLCYALHIVHTYANFGHNNANIFIKRLIFYNDNGTSIMHYDQ